MCRQRDYFCTSNIFPGDDDSTTRLHELKARLEKPQSSRFMSRLFACIREPRPRVVLMSAREAHCGRPGNVEASRDTTLIPVATRIRNSPAVWLFARASQHK